MCSNFTAVFVFGVMVFFTIQLSTLDDIVIRRAQGESESAALLNLRKNVFAQNFYFGWPAQAHNATGR
jgi:hypothetical protein